MPGSSLRQLGREDVPSALLGFGAIALLGLDDGGYFAHSWIWAGLALAAVASAQLLAGRPRVRPPELATLALLAAFGGWTLLSGLWGVVGSDPAREAGRALLYVVGVAAFLLVLDRRSTRPFLIGILAGTLALSAYGVGDRLAGPPPDPYEADLLHQPIGYANAHGILAALGILLALGLVGSGARRSARAGFVLAAAFLAVVLALTESRGASIALGVGIAVLLALGPRRARPFLVVAVAAAAAAVAVARPEPSLGDRKEYWRVALADAADRPLLGSGAGSFDDVWLVERRIDSTVRDAHSLYLETLAELGPVGLALVLAALGLPLAAAARSLRDPVAAAAAAGYIAFLVHAGLDWDWELPAVTLAGLGCGSVLLVLGRPGAGG